MAEQSSAAVALRAIVMLGCLVAIPLVAVFGNALPEAIDRAMGRWWTPDTVAVVDESADEAPLFEPLLRNAPPSVLPDALAAEWPPKPLFDREEPMAGQTVCDSDGCRVLPAAYEAPVETSSGRRSMPGEPLISGYDGGLVPVPHEPPAASADSFEAICRRLKELGSTYVLLESWGDSQEQYRFYCKIAVAGNPHYTYRFEATSPDPMTAMSRVLYQVEDWRAARYGN